MSDSDRQREITQKAREFLEIFRKGEAFTQELLRENERLRYRVLELEQGVETAVRAPSGSGVEQLQQRLAQFEQEHSHLQARFREVEEENKDFARRYVEIEDENNALANLYVASYQLHSTLDFSEVLKIVTEIVINLVGADRFAIYLLDDVGVGLQAVVAEGLDDRRPHKIGIGDGVIGAAVRSGESYFLPEAESQAVAADDPLVCVPLKIHDRVLGALAVFSFLEHKKRKLTKVDYELFSMLAGHAATAIFSAKLYSQSERKLSTIQGFIDLLSGGNP